MSGCRFVSSDPACDPLAGGSPLERLCALLADDLAAVDSLIVARLDSQVEMIPRLARYLIAAGGKRMRPLLTLAGARMFGEETDRPYRLAAAVEFIHTATLLHDDVVDESPQRRAQPSANIIFGNQASVLVGDFLFSRAFQLMVEDGSIAVLRILSDASAIIAQGEVMQLACVGHVNTTRAEYEKIITAKTAALFAAACEIGPVIAGAHPDHVRSMYEFGLNLGIAFQIADDILDYGDPDPRENSRLGKKRGDDFRESKMTAPVLLALEEATDTERAFWHRTIAQKNQTPADFAHALDVLAAHNVPEKGMAMAKTAATKALMAIGKLPESDIRSCLEDLVMFSFERAS